uniref:Breast carcinoma amplified sequence 1 n=1 Tax=Chelydra serpentina TaxID=8475 RepID=A0A8C3RSE2_CHESE
FLSHLTVPQFPICKMEIEILSTPSPVDARTSVEQNNVAVSSQKTIEISSTSDTNEKNLGPDAKKPMPAAKSRFVFAFSRPVPGRTEEQATDSSVGSAKLDVSSEMPEVNKASSEKVDSPATAVLEEGSDKNLSQAPSAAELSDTELIALASPETETAASSKTKQVTLFDRLFKLEKGKEKEKSKTQVETQEESQTTEIPDAGITDIDDCNQKAVQQGSAGVNTDEAAVKQENPKAFATTDYNNSVMSFFKTLAAEKQPVTSINVKAEKNAPPSQDSQTTKQNAKAPEPTAQQQATAVTTEAPKEMAKERSAPTSTPLSKLFWKKSVKSDEGTTSSEETSGSTERPVAPTESEPVGQKSKESSKDKTSTTELSKQETRDQQDSREQQTTATDSIQNGGDTAKDSPLKKIEKRQSLGGFFKGLGPKRMSDAEVQTDPVSILPAGKSK